MFLHFCFEDFMMAEAECDGSQTGDNLCLEQLQMAKTIYLWPH